jgi:hypothetical protein
MGVLTVMMASTSEMLICKKKSLRAQAMSLKKKPRKS